MDKSKLSIKQVAISALIPYARNSRTHDDAQVAQIAASIKEFGWTNPILVDGENGLIAGHGRLLAARKLGMVEVPVIELKSLTEAQKKAYIIADNRLALNAGWDDQMLTIELNELLADKFSLDLLGFNADELNALLNPVEVIDGLTDEDEVPEPPPEPITRPGDVWVLGNHRLMCGSSTVVTDMDKLVNGRQVDMWLTDPPYNVAYGGAKGNAANKNKVDGGNRNTNTILNDDMSDESFREFLRDACTTATIAMKPGAVFYIWHSDSEGYNFRGACRDAGLQVRQCIIWKKSSLVMGRQDYQWIHEPCLYGWKEGAGHLWASDRKQTTVVEFAKPSKNDVHPTMKPVALFEYQMLNNTKGGDIILDSFGGSGTTMIAAEKNGRVGYLMELDPKYCDVIVKRWENFTGKTAILAEL
jgi:site-specific DNA-methyltransferase (adenine-specific)